MLLSLSAQEGGKGRMVARGTTSLTVIRRVGGGEKKGIKPFFFCQCSLNILR